MKGLITAYCRNPSFRNEARDFEIEYPQTCPICGTAVDASELFSTYIKDSTARAPDLFSTFFCNKCELCFLGYYRHERDKYSKKTKLVGFFPKDRYDEKEFSDNIKKLSPDFCKIYQQAYQAEQSGLDEISGIGYRKSLEFLIKDYAILQNETEKEKITNMPLSKCINEYMDNKRIRRLATASAWIGNDATHYVRKHEDYNNKDLKLFIDAAVSFIDSDISSLLAEQLIKDAKSQQT